MKLTGDNILFRPFESDKISDGGIIMPDSYIKESNKGEIVSVGNGVKDLKEGQIAYRVKDWGTPLIENGVTYYIMKDKEILALEE